MFSQTKNLRNFAFAAAFFAVCFLFGASQNVSAATFVVNSTTDAVDATPGDGACATAGAVCTLRAAITEANALAGADIITLPAGTYTETVVAASENLNAGGDFDITSDITINGAGAASTIVQANATAGVATERVFHIRAAAAATALTVVLNGMTIQNGRNAINAFGGGIRIDQSTNSNVTISNSTVTNNLNDTSGGGLSISGATTPTVTITNCTFSNNRAGSATAGTAATGGGIQVSAAAIVNITNTTITGNTATTGLTGVGPTGGGITISFAGAVVTITNSMINTNTASLAVANSASSTFSGGVHLVGGTANLIGSTVNNNVSTATGGTGFGFAGGIYNQQATLNLTNSTVSGNTASNFHAGIRALAQTVATTTNITNSTISNNTAAGEGGGVVNFSVGAASSIITVTRSAIVNNSATAATSAGGGLENISTSTGAATINMNNSTLGGNSAALGGGSYNDGGVATVNFNYSTIASNNATDSGGGLYQDTTAGGVTNIQSSIVADNTATTSGPDIFGVITSGNYNHVENITGGTFTPMANDVTGIDPGLTPLALNGGTTLNYAPGPTSVVRDTIPFGTNQCGVAPFNIDQIGIIRATDTDGNGVVACEKGAREVPNAPTAAAVSVSGRVLNNKQRAVANVVVMMTAQDGTTRTARTNASGYYQFANVDAGQTYIFNAYSKSYQFSTRVVNVNEEMTDLNFAQERGRF